MNSSSPITKENLSITMEAIRKFEEANKFKDNEIEELSRKALLLQKVSDKEWLLEELSNFHENKKKDEEKEKVKQIKPTCPVTIKNLKDLDEVLKKHKIWMDSILNSGEIGTGTRANLNGADLAGLTLTESNLTCSSLNEASFIGAKLSGVNFSRASLKKASFEGATIINCNFHQADLEDADFRESDLLDTEFSEDQKKRALGLF